MSSNFAYSREKFILLGVIGKAHGMKGEVKIYCYSEQPDNIKNYQEVVLVDNKGKLSPHLKIKKSRSRGKIAITLLETITDRTRAEYIEGMGVLLPKAALPEIDQNEYYWHQLIGKTVVDTGYNDLGIIKNIFSNGAQDILVLKNSQREHLIPIVEGIVLSTHLEKVVIDPPEGLLNINKQDYSS